jgi:hypothetical protein
VTDAADTEKLSEPGLPAPQPIAAVLTPVERLQTLLRNSLAPIRPPKLKVLHNQKQSMRVRLKGINSVRKKLADGSWRTYYYAWKGGPPLRGEPGTPEFSASYNAAVATRATPPQGTLLAYPVYTYIHQC